MNSFGTTSSSGAVFLTQVSPAAALSEPTKAESTKTESLDMDNFVDFYELLDMPLSSTGIELRKTISTLYLEAQKNLDHRSLQKKQFFQLLYEVHLPRARYLLLDEKRRTEYDAHVHTFRADRSQQRAAQNPEAAEDLSFATSSAENLTKAVPLKAEIEENMAPEEVAARRETLWQQWQTSLEASAVASEIAPLVFTPEQAVREEVRNVYMRKTAVVVREEERIRREESLRRQQSRWEVQQQQQEAERRQSEAEKQKIAQAKQQRLEDAKAARQTWTWGSGMTLFALGTLLVFALLPSSSTGSSKSSSEILSGHRPYGGAPAAVPGKIELEDFDLGLEGRTYHKKTRTVNGAGGYRSGSGVFTTQTDFGYAVTNTAAGEWLDYTINVAQSGVYDLDVAVASPKGGGTFFVSFNGQNKSGTLTVPSTGDGDKYQNVAKKGIELPAGQQVMRITFVGVADDGQAGNFDSVSLRTGTAAKSGFLSQLGAQIGAFLKPLLLVVLALACFALGQQIGSAAEKRVLQKA